MTSAAPVGRVLPIRRALKRPEAAAYVGVSPTKFDQWVSDGRMPRCIPIDGVRLWDVRALDEAFDRMAYGSGLPIADDQRPNPWDEE